ncbi:MAG: hypothetical protein HPY44_22020 [Armatimonadetes bacterium]|nr:hypothetical protein [Armatimonadota bacterium]
MSILALPGLVGRRPVVSRWLLTGVLLLLATLALTFIGADTTVSGTISTHTTWTVDNSPYVLSGNVTVANGATLTIEPGVTVSIGSSYSLQVGEGTLLAVGLASAPVVFTGGGYVRLNAGSDASELVYCQSSCPITISSRPVLSNSTFSGSVSFGGTDISASVTGCTFTGSLSTTGGSTPSFTGNSVSSVSMSGGSAMELFRHCARASEKLWTRS